MKKNLKMQKVMKEGGREKKYYQKKSLTKEDKWRTRKTTQEE